MSCALGSPSIPTAAILLLREGGQLSSIHPFTSINRIPRFQWNPPPFPLPLTHPTTCFLPSFIVVPAARRLAALARCLRADLATADEDAAPARVMLFVNTPAEAAAVAEPLRTSLWSDHRMAVLVPPGEGKKRIGRQIAAPLTARAKIRKEKNSTLTSRDGDVADLVGVGTRTVGGWWAKLERARAPKVN